MAWSSCSGFQMSRRGNWKDLVDLHPFEQLATRNGPKIVVSINGKPAGELNSNAPDLLVSLPSEKKFDFAYVGPSGELTDVSWSQTVKPNEQKLVVMQPWRRPDREHRWHYCLGEAARQLRPERPTTKQTGFRSPRRRSPC